MAAVEPNDNDVLHFHNPGRRLANFNNDHPGNQDRLQLVRESFQEFWHEDTTKLDRRFIVILVIQEIQDRGGRFLKQNENGQFSVMTDYGEIKKKTRPLFDGMKYRENRRQPQNNPGDNNEDPGDDNANPGDDNADPGDDNANQQAPRHAGRINNPHPDPQLLQPAMNTVLQQILQTLQQLLQGQQRHSNAIQQILQQQPQQQPQPQQQQQPQQQPQQLAAVNEDVLDVFNEFRGNGENNQVTQNEEYR
ncbi:unnamed protein product [Cylindrotheca closterium]|uniref:DUF6824 domain-containing protein n=1 Tax=Cylindrotheca closterium TaxID=2856 RepID=A0AAD2PUF7_9STRA|nr:unnamed protein product [Cylindrotheca closterium]